MAALFGITYSTLYWGGDYDPDVTYIGWSFYGYGYSYSYMGVPKIIAELALICACGSVSKSHIKLPEVNLFEI